MKPFETLYTGVKYNCLQLFLIDVFRNVYSF